MINTSIRSLLFACLLINYEVKVEGELILHGPSDGAQIVGGKVVFYCDLVDSVSNARLVNQAYSIVWTFQPRAANSTQEVVKTTVYDGKNLFTSKTSNTKKFGEQQDLNLQVLNISLSDAGWYACRSNLTATTPGAHLMVIGHPICHNENHDVYYKQNISLECIVRYSGVRHPVVEWRYGVLRLNSSTEQEENSTTLVEKLVLEASDRVRGHIYHCRAYYPGFNAVECLALPAIQVYGPAEVMAVHVFPVSRYNEYPVGSSLTLKCVGHGYPFPTFSWSFISSKTGQRVDQISLTNQLNILNFTEQQVGTYECQVNNEIVTKPQDETGVEAEDYNVHIFNNSYQVNISLSETNMELPGKNEGFYDRHTSSGQPGIKNGDTGMHFSPYAIGALISGSLAVLLIILFVILAMRMKKRERRMKEKMARIHDENLDDQEVELLDESAQPNSDFLPSEYSRLKMSWEISRKDVRLLEQIGQGAYVEVWKGRMRRSPGSTEVMRVIIKKLRGDASDKERHFFRAELEVLKMLPAHGNVIRLVGSYTANEPWLMMIEMASEGTLQQFLQRHSPGCQQVLISNGDKPSVSMSKKQILTPQKLLALAAQVASGLDHLEKFKLIYYRLRTCKILVAKGGICKLSGFGFPPEMTDRNMYESNSVPVRWAAPESLQSQVFNVKTDTWSYGILVWEILHFGTTPYPTMGPHEVMENIHNGFRMPQPSHCSSELYELLLRCWHTIPEERPSYQEILNVLSHLVVNADVHIDFSSLPDHLLSLDTADSATF